MSEIFKGLAASSGINIHEWFAAGKRKLPPSWTEPSMVVAALLSNQVRSVKELKAMARNEQ
jgi:hypothetical protein